MWQLIRWLVSMFCGVPWFLRIFLFAFQAAFATIVNPLFWLLVVIPIYFTKNPMSTNEDGTKDFNKSFGYSYLISFLILWITLIVAQFSVCAVSDKLGEYGV